MRQSVQALRIYPKQHEFRSLATWLKAFFGGRGTGKTFVGALDIQQRAKNEEPWLCVSPDNNVVRETTLPTFVELAKQTGRYVKHVLSPSPKVHFRTSDNGIASIVFRSAEAPEKLRGGNYAGIWLDEASVMPRIVYELAIPTNRFRGKSGPVILTATPKGLRHWTFEALFDVVDPDLLELIGNDGSSAVGIEWFGGRPYRLRDNTGLVRASTRDNPFLPPDFYDNIRRNYGSMLAQQELEGDFCEVAGLMFRREWFEFVSQAPVEAMRVRYWDQAASLPGQGCYTAGVLMARDAHGLFYVEHVIRGQWGALERNRVIDQITEHDARKYRGEVLTFVEQEGGSGGKEVAAQMITRLAGHPVFRDVVSGKRFRFSGGEQLPGEAKIVRAMPLSAQAEAGNVRIVRGAWCEDFLQELAAFPEWTFCDQVDAASGAFNKLCANDYSLDPGNIQRIETGSSRSQQFGALAILSGAKSSRWEQIWSSDDE